MIKTKIICTLGPSVDAEAVLEQLVLAGMNVARLNFSHGTHDEHLKRINRIKEIRQRLKLPISLLLDIKGPKIRLGKFKNTSVNLTEGNKFVLLHNDVLGDETKASISYKDLYKDVKISNKILINDGLVELKVEKIIDKDIYCVVINGGEIGDEKGINVPECSIKVPFVSDKDVADILFGIENDVDFIAASFVRNASDIIEIKKILGKESNNSIQVIAKIENRDGILNIDEIIKASAGILVARGDLGVEIPIEEVPITQKMLIKKCLEDGKPVITATQMLNSMISNPRPTRAEASDVANAIYDSTSAIMLSGETSIGKYPVESLKTMVKIAKKTENSIDYWERFRASSTKSHVNVTNAICRATCSTAMSLNAPAIITVTHSGYTPRMVSKLRPNCPIIATTAFEKVQNQLSLSWGVYPYLIRNASTTDEIFDIGVKKALDSGYVKDGDLVVITAGVPVGYRGTTNIIKVQVARKG